MTEHSFFSTVLFLFFVTLPLQNESLRKKVDELQSQIDQQTKENQESISERSKELTTTKEVGICFIDLLKILKTLRTCNAYDYYHFLLVWADFFIRC